MPQHGRARFLTSTRATLVEIGREWQLGARSDPSLPYRMWFQKARAGARRTALCARLARGARCSSRSRSRAFWASPCVRVSSYLFAIHGGNTLCSRVRQQPLCSRVLTDVESSIDVARITMARCLPAPLACLSHYTTRSPSSLHARPVRCHVLDVTATTGSPSATTFHPPPLA